MKILYRDDDIIVCIKPAGALSTDEAGGMPDLIRKELKKESEIDSGKNLGDSMPVLTVHRLDSVVAGLMVYAFTKSAASELTRQMEADTFVKEYMAVLEGVPDKAEDRLQDYLKRNRAERKTYAVKRRDRYDRDAQEAILNYKTLAKSRENSLVRIKLVTGRTHQIRAQFSSRGLPLYGDGKYGSSHKQANIALWSCHLNFRHPVTGKVMDFEAMPPAREPWTMFRGFTASYDEADVVVKFQRSRNLSDCPFAETCGNCAYQGMDYAKQLEKKQKLAGKWLKKYGDIEAIIGSDRPLGYKDKAVLLFGKNKQGEIVLGVPAAAGRKFVKTDRCPVNNPVFSEIGKSMVSLMKDYRILPFDEKEGKGWLRAAWLWRNGEGRIMLVLAATSKVPESGNMPDLPEKFAKALTEFHPEIETVVLNVNSSPKSFGLGKESQVLLGEGVLDDELLGVHFKVSPKSFFPVNHVQYERLYQTALDFAGLTGTERVLDAYCDTGILSMAAAGKAAKVFGVNANQAALQEAMDNGKRNGAENIKWVASEPEQYVTALARSHDKMDAVFINAPFRGCSPEVLEGVTRLGAEKLVYLSGNPESAAKDLDILCKGNYTVQKIQPVDVFSYESRVEIAALLTRK